MKNESKQQNPKVTIAIGIISTQAEVGRGEIVLATDSQMTYDDGSKDSDQKKIHEIRFKNASILIADSGMVNQSMLAVDTMQRMASDTEIENRDSIISLIELSMREVREKLTAGQNFTAERLKSFLTIDVWFEFLIGFYLSGKAELLRVGIYDCTVTPVEKKHYGTIGCGCDLARYLLSEYHEMDNSFVLAQNIALATIAEVKNNVKGCGGNTQIGIIWPDEKHSTHIIMNPEEISDWERQFKNSEAKHIAAKRELMLSQIQISIGGKLGKEISEHYRKKFND